jgi:hypothetical protein
MEVNRYTSICFFIKEMKKNLFNINLNNSADELNLLFPQLANFDYLSECKKINLNKKKKIN